MTHREIVDGEFDSSYGQDESTIGETWSCAEARKMRFFLGTGLTTAAHRSVRKRNFFVGGAGRESRNKIWLARTVLVGIAEQNRRKQTSEYEQCGNQGTEYHPSQE